MDYRKHIGDGKLPNRYWVFHYDEKKIKNNDDKWIEGDSKGGLIGEYKTYREAIDAVNYKAYLPHVCVEDRLTGVIFEQVCVICPCCETEDWLTYDDSRLTRDQLGADFE